MDNHIQIKDAGIKDENWSIDCYFDKPISPLDIKFEEIQFEYPKDLSSKIKESWDVQLSNKQSSLSTNGINTNMRFYDDISNKLGFNALYNDEGKCVMWPGSVVLLDNWEVKQGKLIVKVFSSVFPIINGLKDESIRNIFISSNIKIPRPPLAICTFSITSDNFLVLTVRGIKTNMYPGRYYGQGGNPTNPNINVINHQIDEMVEEINISEDDINKDSFKLLGIASDQELIIGKPDIFGIVSLNIDSKTLLSKFNSREQSARPNDSVDIKLINFDKESIISFLKSTKDSDFCPPARAGLSMIYKNFF